MTDRKYKFSIDESRPQIPPPKDFSTLLAGVKAQIPWYAKSAFWGGAASVAVAGVAAFWWFQNKEVPLPETPKPQLENREVVRESIQTPEAITPIIETEQIEETENVAIRNESSSVEQVLEDRIEFGSVEHFAADAIAPEIKVETTSKVSKGWRFSVKYDTIRINTAYLPKEFSLGRDSRVLVPAEAFVDADGKTVYGEVLLLYREFVDQADLLVSSMYMEAMSNSNAAPLINNGAFEVQVVQHGKHLKIQPKAPLLLHYNTLDPALVFTGFHAKENGDVWKPMFVTAIKEVPTQQTMVADRMAMKRSLGEWLSDVIHGRGARWDTFERVEDVPQDVAYYDYGVYKNVKAFEILECGFFASGRTMDMGFTSVGKLNIGCENGEKLEGKLYQVFLNTNMVREYDIVDGKCAVQYSSTDRCMFIAIVENSGFIAVLDANNFDKQIKGNMEEISVTLKLHPYELRKLNDLKNAIKTYGGLKARKV